jgi:outer membrane immunogenic protein
MLHSVKSTTLVSLAALFFASPALSADLAKGGDPTAADYQAPFSWTGLYIGGRFGYGNANHNLSVDQYFKDYCGDSSQPEDHGFDDPDLDNRIDYLGVDGTLTCAKFSGPEDTTPDPNFDNVVVDGQSREVASLDGLNSSGITGGAQIGFDYQMGRVVVGVFGSYDLSSMDTTASLGPIDLTLIEKGDEWTVGARAGYLLHPRVLAYVLAGYTQADWTFGDGLLGKKEVTFEGVTVGGGLEYALTQNVFIGLEGTHTFYGKETILDDYDAEDNEGGRLNDEIGETKVLGTLKIKLNSDIGSSLGL